MMYLFFALEIIIISTLWYWYLHKKTRINVKFLYMDNLVIIIPLLFLSSWLIKNEINIIVIFIINLFLIFGLSFTFTMLRFWRTPKRKIIAKENEIVSPADGNVIYLTKYEKGEVPVSIKKGLRASLTELTTVPILNNNSYWLLGINMTPFDVHKNCAPVSGKIVLNKHINGSFLSLKEPEAILRNERNTLVIKTAENEYFGIIQTASRLVRRIDSYVKGKQDIKKGEWFGMIRFGSQVDVIIPIKYNIKVKAGQQLYALKSIIASK